MTDRRLSLKPSGRMDYIAVLLLVVAFSLAGWKLSSRVSSANFTTVVQQSPIKANSTEAILKRAADEGSPQYSSDDCKKFDAQFVSSAPGQAVHAASIVELEGGHLRAVWFSGSKEGAGDVSIQSAVLDAKTHKWGRESTLFNRVGIEKGLWRYVKKVGNPLIARSSDGSLYLWMVNVSLGGWAGSSITWSRSVDEGANWSVPRRLVTSPFLNISTLVKGAPISFVDGDIGLPIYHEFVTKFAEILRINPQGQVVDKVRIPGSQTSLQPVVLVTGPLQAQVYMRSGRGANVMMATTDDAGKTWSSSRATAWPNPDSALAGLVTDTGRQWLALNATPAGREKLGLLETSKGGTFDGVSPVMIESSGALRTTLSLVDFENLLGHELKTRGADDAQTHDYVASAKRQLCGQASCSQEFSYPYLIQTSDGYIHLVYTWHRTRIKHVRFDPLRPAPNVKPVCAHASSVN